MCSLSQKHPLCKCNVFTNHLSSGGTLAKNPSPNEGDTRDTGSIPGSEGSAGVGIGHPLQYSCWRIPGTEEGYSPRGCRESDTTEQAIASASTVERL